MKYPNLIIATHHKRRTALELADLLKISPSTLSRKVTGRAEFLPHERYRIGEFLAFDPVWLFTEATIPASARRETAVLRPAIETR